ncbi:hypothetical protein Tco_0104810 [Tanacetum coccineum]
MLTVQKLQPAYTDIDKIMRNGESVGYQASSFVYNKLKGMGFDESHLKNYSNFEQYDKALELGSQSEGVSAIAFPKGSPLVADVSRAILQVTEEVREMLVSQGSVGQKLASIAKTFDVFKDGESKTTTAEAVADTGFFSSDEGFSTTEPETPVYDTSQVVESNIEIEAHADTIQ